MDSVGTLVLPELTWELAGFERLGPLRLPLVSGKPLRCPSPAFPFSPSFPSLPYPGMGSCFGRQLPGVEALRLSALSR